MVKISVIVPVYNCEKYLPMCLDSIILQTYENLEIICINDGSKDNSLKILNKYAQRDNRIRIINQKNLGQSRARNYGTELATGDYISYVDADDWVSLSLYEKFMNTLNEVNRDVDIFLFNACEYNEKTTDLYLKPFFNINEWKNNTNFYFIHTFNDCSNPFYGNMAAYNKIYKKEFLTNNALKFIPDLIFEDQLFYIETFLKAKSILINNDFMYMYRRTNSKSTTRNLGKRVFDIFKIMYQIEKIIKNTGNYEEYKYALFQHKYTQFSFLFFEAPFLLKPRFYDWMKARLLMTEEEKLNKEICKKLVGYRIFEDIISMDWFNFYQKYKNKKKI